MPSPIYPILPTEREYLMREFDALNGKLLIIEKKLDALLLLFKGVKEILEELVK